MVSQVSASARTRRQTKVIPPMNTTAEPPAIKSMPKIADKVLLDNLTSAELLHRDALEIELAVGLTYLGLHSDASKASKEAKKGLRAIYEKAGYACRTPAGEDYKTVMRKIGITSDLYGHIGGRETLVDWIGDAKTGKQVGAVVEHLKTYNFTGMADVQKYVGKGPVKRAPRQQRAQTPAVQTSAPAPQNTAMDEALALVDQSLLVRRLAEQKGIPEGRVFKHGALTLVIPFEATYNDVVGMAQDLMAFAKTQMPLPTPAPQPTTTTVVQ